MSDYGDLVSLLMDTEANRAGEHDPHEAAVEAILASDWLAQRDRRVKAEAWDEAADYDNARAIVRGCEGLGDPVPNPYCEATS